MGKAKSIFGNIILVIYVVTVMWWLLLLLPLVPIMTIFSDIPGIINSGFSSSNTGIAFIGIFGLFIGISLLIPPLPKMYYKLPWLFPYVKIFYVDVIIMSIATILLNIGYEVQSDARHVKFFILMVAQIIICRVLMCIYFWKKNVNHIGGGGNGTKG